MDAPERNLMENPNPQPKPFCVAPFMNFYYKGAKTRSLMRPCCESRVDYADKYTPPRDFTDFWRGQLIQDIRKSMLEGKPHEICDRCIEVENSGGLNSREFYKRILNKFEQEYCELEYDVLKGNQFDNPVSIDYRGSNLCNLKCRMCHVGSSSEIAKEVIENAEDYDKINIRTNNSFLYKENKDINTFIEQIPLHNVMRIKFLGGEPLLQEDVYKGLEKVALESWNSAKVDIGFTTNATNFPPRFLDLIGKFRQVLMRISLDGVEDSYEYVRSNGNWEKVKDNCVKLFEKNYKRGQLVAGFSFIVQAYSIFDIIKFLQFCVDLKRKNYSVWSEPFFSPIEQDWLSTAILDQEDIKHVIEQLDEFNANNPDQNYVESIKNIILNFDQNRKITDQDREQFKTYTNTLDKIRKTSLININQRFEKYL